MTPQEFIKQLYEDCSEEELKKMTFDYDTVISLMQSYSYRNKNEYHTSLTGWICPRCQTIYSPFTSKCNCSPIKTTSHTYNQIL